MKNVSLFILQVTPSKNRPIFIITGIPMPEHIGNQIAVMFLNLLKVVNTVKIPIMCPIYKPKCFCQTFGKHARF